MLVVEKVMLSTLGITVAFRDYWDAWMVEGRLSAAASRGLIDSHMHPQHVMIEIVFLPLTLVSRCCQRPLYAIPAWEGGLRTTSLTHTRRHETTSVGKFHCPEGRCTQGARILSFMMIAILSPTEVTAVCPPTCKVWHI